MKKIIFPLLITCSIPLLAMKKPKGQLEKNYLVEINRNDNTPINIRIFVEAPKTEHSKKKKKQKTAEDLLKGFYKKIVMLNPEWAQKKIEEDKKKNSLLPKEENFDCALMDIFEIIKQTLPESPNKKKKSKKKRKPKKKKTTDEKDEKGFSLFSKYRPPSFEDI